MTKIGKNKHIGIYIHHQDKEHWLRIKELLPYFSCKLTLLSSLDIRSEICASSDQCDFIKLPASEPSAYPSFKNDCETHKKRMNILFNFVYRERPDLFYIDESVEVATFVNLLGVPYVFTRNKHSAEDDFGLQMAYGLSLFNIAPYDNAKEDQWYKNTPFYQKTKYSLQDKSEINKKLVCMYLEDEFCLKTQEPVKPLMLNAL